jgi:hypothetical protein
MVVVVVVVVVVTVVVVHDGLEPQAYDGSRM